MYGQLGHGSTDKQSSPKVVEALSDRTVYLLACGNFHTVSSLNHVYNSIMDPGWYCEISYLGGGRGGWGGAVKVRWPIMNL